MNSNTKTEITLYDIWNTIVKQKKVFWVVFILFTVLGIAISFFMPKHYEYEQTITIGNFVDKNGAVTPIVSLDDKFKTMLTESLLKRTVTIYNIIHKDTPIVISPQKLNINFIPGNTIKLTFIGSTKDQSIAYREIFSRLFGQIRSYTDQLTQNQKSYIDSVLTNLEEQQTSQKAMLDQLKTLLTQIGPKIDQTSLINLQHTLLKEMTDTNQQIQILQLKEKTFTNSSIFIDFSVDINNKISKNATILLTILAAIFFGIFATFIAEFVQKNKH